MSKKVEPYVLDDLDREMLELVRNGLDMHTRGDPIKDCMSEDDFIEALRLLMEIVDAGHTDWAPPPSEPFRSPYADGGEGE